MNYCGRISSELSCMSSAAGGQSIVPGFSESPQSCCEEGAQRLVDIYLLFRECERASHTVVFELYTSQSDMAPASRATFVKDLRAMVESFCNRFRRFSDRQFKLSYAFRVSSCIN